MKWKVMEISRVMGGVSLDEGMRLGDYAAKVPVEQAIVEVGAHAGASTTWLAMGSFKGLGAPVFSVDLWEQEDARPRVDRYTAVEVHEHFRTQIAYAAACGVIDAGCVHEVQGESVATAARWPEVDGRPIGLLHIDGSHLYEQCKADLEAWAPYVAVGGVVVVHDWSMERVRRAVKEWLAATDGGVKQIGFYRWKFRPQSRGQWVGRRVA